MSRNRKSSAQHDPRSVAELTSKAADLTERAFAVTAPIYHSDDKERPAVYGSGVLLQIAGVRLIATAGHVLDYLKKGQLAVGAAGELLALAGLPTRLRTPGTDSMTDDDRIDIGVMRLSGGPWDALPLEHFLSWDELDHITPLAATHSYALIGFPESINRRAVEGDRIRVAAYRVAVLECDLDSYYAHSIDPTSHVMLGFDRNETLDEGGTRTSPNLYGASGGGLWRFGRRIRDASQPPRLSAIATRWEKRGRYKHILGTRIQLVVEALADKYDDIRAFAADHVQQ